MMETQDDLVAGLPESRCQMPPDETGCAGDKNDHGEQVLGRINKVFRHHTGCSGSTTEGTIMQSRYKRQKPWKEALRAAIGSGSSGALLSTLALAVAGRVETGSFVAPTNAISHWIWGDRAARHDEASVRYTLVGYVTHHVASIFWALFYERWFGRAKDRGDVSTAIAGAATVSALACVVDYQLTPRRLQPGYEMRLSRSSLAVVYSAFGIGLAVGALFTHAAAERRSGRREAQHMI